MASASSKSATNRLVVVEDDTIDDSSVCYIRPATTEALSIFPGDAVLLEGEGERRTACVVLHDERCEEHKLRINKVVRSNLGVRAADVVSVRLCRDDGLKYGNRVHIRPVEGGGGGGVEAGKLLETYLKPYFLHAYRPVYKGDVFLVRCWGMPSVEFKVMEVDAAGDDMCVVAPHTKITCDSEPVKRAAKRLVVEEEEDDEATINDNSVCKIHPDTMEALSLFPGDVVLLEGEGERRTVCVALHDKRCGEHKLKLNKVVRFNLRVRAADVVSVRQCLNDELKFGNRVHILPVEGRGSGGGGIVEAGKLLETHLKPYFLHAYRPVYKGDVFLVRRGGMPSVEFKVVAIDAARDNMCVVAPHTKIMCSGEPVKRAANELVVEEDTIDDNSVCCIHPATMEALSLFRGDVVLLEGEGERRTACVVLHNERCEEHKLRINKVVRSNLGVRAADVVSVRLCRDDGLKYGNRVHIRPVEGGGGGVEAGKLLETYLKPYFLHAYRPVYKGDVFLVRCWGMPSVEFKVMEVDAAGDDMCVVAPHTKITCDGEQELDDDEKEAAAPTRHPLHFKSNGVKSKHLPNLQSHDKKRGCLCWM